MTTSRLLTRVLTWACLTALLGSLACAPRTRPPPVSTATIADTFPVAEYIAASAQGKPVYRINSDQSVAEILVRKAGPLARFGHDHVIVAHHIEGFMLLPSRLEDSQADLRIPVSSFEVDPEAARIRYQLDSTPTQKDIEGTRTNMLAKVLHAQSWPEVHLHITYLSGHSPELLLSVEMRIHGATHTYIVPVRLVQQGTEIVIKGDINLQQTDFGMRPFSIFGGGLRVADGVEIHFSLNFYPA